MFGIGAAGLAGSGLMRGESPAAARPAQAAAPAASTAAVPTETPPELRTRFTDEWGIAYPIIQAGLGFYAVPDLVSVVCNAGAMGCLGAVPEEPEGVRAMIRETKARTDRPFGIDYVYFPFFGATAYSPGYEKSDEHETRQVKWTCNDQHIDVLVEEGIAFVVWFWTPPEARWVKRLKAAGIKQYAQIGSVRGAKEAVEWGADGVICQGWQAGGHNRGYQDGRPKLRKDLVPLVKAAIPSSLMLLSSGGIADGRTLADALLEGAEAGWCGTVFTTSAESWGHDKYKQEVIDIKDGWEETQETQLFGPEWPRGYMRVKSNRVVKEWGHREDVVPTPPPPPAIVGTTMLAPYSSPGGTPYAMPKFSLAIPSRSTEGDFEEMPILCGSESATIVKEVKPAAQIVAEMVEEARAILAGRR